MRFVVPTGLIFILCAPLALAGCVLPLPPLNFPDDTTANSEVITLTKRRVEGYLDNSARFIKCLDTTAKMAIGTGRSNEERRRRRINSYNVGLDNITQVVRGYERSVQRLNNR
jgi:hypothetical protein